MAQTTPTRRGSSETQRGAQAELAELCRVHDVALEMIERSDDLDVLLDRILDEYEARLRDLPENALENGARDLPRDVASKVRALVLFAAQASALKEKATLSEELRQRAEALSDANARLAEALDAAECARQQLDAVLSTLDAGILILGRDGRVRHANPAANRLTGSEVRDLRGVSLGGILEPIPRGADGEIVVSGENGDGRVLMVARRELGDSEGAEVVLLSDITLRSREIEEQHRIEKLGEVLRTLSVLSHKINNPLTALMGRAQMLRVQAGTDPKVVKAASVIEESAGRIAELIRELARVVKEGRQEAVEKVLTMGVGADGGGAS